MYSAEQTNKLAQWRARAASGEITLEEMHEAIVLLREGRIAAAPKPKAPKKPRGKAAQPQPAPSPDLLTALLDQPL